VAAVAPTQQDAATEPGAGRSARPRLLPWLAPLVLLALPLLVYGHTLNNGWVIAPADDLRWLSLVQGTPLRDLPSWFSHQEAFFYRPLARLSLYLDSLVWGSDPFGFRLSGLLLYALAALALGGLVCELTGSRRAGALAAAGYELFPGNWEVAYWVSARADLLAALFVFLTLTLLHRAWHQRRLACWLGGLGCTAAALFSKETGLALLPVVVVWALVAMPPLRRSGRYWAWVGLTLGLLLALAAGYWTLRSGATYMGTQHLAPLRQGQLRLLGAMKMGGEWWWHTPLWDLHRLCTGHAPGVAALLAVPGVFLEWWGGLLSWLGGVVLVARTRLRTGLMLAAFYPLALLPVCREIATVPYRRFYYLPVAGSLALTGIACWALMTWSRRYGSLAWAASVATTVILLASSAWGCYLISAGLGSRLFGR